MAGFSVDTDAVAELGRQLAQVSNDLSNTAQPGGLSDAEAGSSAVSQALSEFHSHWQAARASLLDNLGKLAGAIGQSATSYDRSDTAVAHAADGAEE